MSNRLSIVTLLLGALRLGGWALGQQGPAGQKKLEPRFMVAPAGTSAVLLETTTGDTWVLDKSVDGTSVWQRAKRFDQENDFLLWQQKEREKRRKRLEPPK